MNLDAIRRQTDLIGKLRQELQGAEAHILACSGKAGQSTSARVTVNGIAFDILRLGPGYMPELVKGMEAMQREAIRLLTMHRDSIRSQLEGAEWQLRQLTKATA